MISDLVWRWAASNRDHATVFRRGIWLDVVQSNVVGWIRRMTRENRRSVGMKLEILETREIHEARYEADA